MSEIDTQKPTASTGKILTQTKNLHISCADMSTIYVGEQSQKSFPRNF